MRTKIGDEGAKRLTDGLRCNTALLLLQLDREHAGPIEKVLSRNRLARRGAETNRKLVFVWCLEIRNLALPEELTRILVRQSEWNCEVLPLEMQPFWSTGE
eukprot:TRINITY_DN5512_c0_g1_i3.p5 TRINITY_DN5512_c0_g1~~TRINITY_DN5512_c0_g1_i3.p5  ORF type:complete len:101 (+),score=19.19 TRINITY_DN5512_c0_g1_i3:270-572(+)